MCIFDGSRSRKARYTFKRVLAMRVCIVLLVCNVAAYAEEGQHHHGAHQHGIGELGVVFEQNQFSFLLRVPASDLIGFEHTPETAEERLAITKLEQDLKEGQTLFIFQEQASCQQVAHKLLHGLSQRGTDGGEEMTTEHAVEHHHDSKQVSHSEVSIEYRFDCQHPDKLTTVQTTLFTKFPSLKRIEAAIVTPSFQGKQDLHPAASLLNLSH